jgi:hypothetical protein
MLSIRLSLCSIIWIVGIINCELDILSKRSQLLASNACLEQKTSTSGCPTSYSIRESHSAEGLDMRAKVVGQSMTLKRGDVLSLRGGGGCMSCFPRKSTKQTKDHFVSFQLDVYFNTSALNFSQFYPGILGSCEILGLWKENQVHIMQAQASSFKNLPLNV